VAVSGVTQENRQTGIANDTRFSLVALPDQRNAAASGTNSAATALGATSFLRPEDGAWDPRNPNVFYFNTTDRYDEVKDGVGTQEGRSRLWQLTFNDVRNPEAGGTIRMLLDGTEPHNMLDNMAIDAAGNIYLQEDVGNQGHNGKIWMYDRATGTLRLLARHDIARFGDLGLPGSLTQDEESSGIIDITSILEGVRGRGNRYFLLDDQAHYALGGELVEGGQLLLMTMTAPVPEPSTYAMLAASLGVMGTIARRRGRRRST
jgi:hypothetical protein